MRIIPSFLVLLPVLKQPQQCCHHHDRILRIVVVSILVLCCWVSIFINSDYKYKYNNNYESSTRTSVGGGSIVNNNVKLHHQHHLRDTNNKTSTNSTKAAAAARLVNGGVSTEEEEDIITIVPPFYPDLALEKYKQRHSQQVLLNEYNKSKSSHENNNFNNFNNQRKYAVVYYWCPDRAGNILHNMFNSITWSIITNRTILLKYYYENNNTSTSNSSSEQEQEECEKILKRSKWIPTYEEWYTRIIQLNLEEKIPIIPIPIDPNRVRYDQQHAIVTFPQIPDIDYGNPHLYRNTWRDDPIHAPHSIEYITGMLNNHEAKQTAGKLYYEGVNYLMGMLFRNCFTVQIQPQQQQAIPQQQSAVQQRNPGEPQKIQSTTSSRDGSSNSSITSSLSIVLHSRHPVVGDDGSYVREEMDCLQQLITNYYSADKDEDEEEDAYADDGEENCEVYLLSDRPLTIEKLSNWLLEHHNCTPVFVHHNNDRDDNVDREAATTMITEHGPNSGIGFIEDLVLATTTQAQPHYAVIGDFHRSSFMLVVEIIEYDRKIATWKMQMAMKQEQQQQQQKSNTTTTATGTPVGDDDDIDNINTPDLMACTLRDRPSSGYDYGPGTPTFRHHTLQEPLQPIQMMNRYMKWHSTDDDAAAATASSRRYVQVTYSCSNGTLDHYHILNGLLWAIATNQTVLFDNLDKDCHDMFLPRDWLMSLTAEWSSQLHQQRIMKDTDATAIQVADTGHSETLIVVFPRTSQKILNASALSNLIPPSTFAEDATQDMIEKLYGEGIDFLYGMLFDLSFEFSSLVQNAIPNGLQTDRSFQTVALQLSQGNVRPTNDVSAGVTECLESVLMMPRQTVGLAHNQETPPCHVYIMNDETMGFDYLSGWLMERNCSAWRANLGTTAEGNNSSKEERTHGTTSQLLSYFQNVVLLSMARSAWIGHSDGSHNDLILELIEFHRRMEIWKLGRDPPLLTDLTTCILPSGG